MIIHGIFNYWKDEVEIEVFPGEEICPVCKGHGTRTTIGGVRGYNPFGRCGRCKGEGKIDWIQKAMGQI
jgi:DnaJ-class molecular chaperone